MRIGLLNNLRAGRNETRVRRLLGYLRRHPGPFRIGELGDRHHGWIVRAIERLGRQHGGMRERKTNLQ